MENNNKLRILVLVGGTSAERDVSLASGQAVIKALQQRGHQVLAIDTACGRKLLDTTRPLIPQGIAAAPPDGLAGPLTSQELASALTLPETSAVDVVFLALHGGDGEDGHVQALLDLARVAHTGSGATASALAMNKLLAKKIFVAENIPTPAWVYVEQRRPGEVRVTSTQKDMAASDACRPGAIVPEYQQLARFLGTPFVVKPNEQGSTVGLTIVEQADELGPAFARAFEHGPGVLVEQYIPGRELTVAVLGEESLPVVEIVPEHGIYDYECKYTSGKSNYICPADLSASQTERSQSLGLKAFNALGCSGYGRVDFRLNSQGEFYCLEVNTLPGMTSTSLVPKAAAAKGIVFPDLIEQICRLAIK